MQAEVTVETDKVLSAIRRGEDSLPKLRAATGLEYAKLHVELHKLEFESRLIQRSETSEGFDRYAPTPSEKTNGLKGTHWRDEPQGAMPVTPKALHSTQAAASARELALLQREAPYCITCRGLCVPHGTDRTGKNRWRCRACAVTFAGSGAVKDLNRIAPEKRQAAISAFNEAKSVRAVAAEVGISKQTAEKIRREEKIEAVCPCGQDAKHKGWCAHRFQQSPARQETVEKMNMGRIDPHEEAEKEIAAMIERGRTPKAQPVDDAAKQARRNLGIAEPPCGCGYTANHRGRCRDGQAKKDRKDARVSTNGHAQKSVENITETITANGENHLPDKVAHFAPSHEEQKHATGVDWAEISRYAANDFRETQEQVANGIDRMRKLYNLMLVCDGAPVPKNLSVAEMLLDLKMLDRQMKNTAKRMEAYVEQEKAKAS